MDDRLEEQDCDAPDENEICLERQKTFTANDKCIQCSISEIWSHEKCTGMIMDDVKILASKSKRA